MSQGGVKMSSNLSLSSKFSKLKDSDAYYFYKYTNHNNNTNLKQLL